MPILSTPCGTGYTPRAYTNDLKDVVEENLEELFRVYDERFARTYLRPAAPQGARSHGSVRPQSDANTRQPTRIGSVPQPG